MRLWMRMSTVWERSSVSRDSVQRDFPEEARVCREVVLLVSPREVERARVVVGMVERGVVDGVWVEGVDCGFDGSLSEEEGSVPEKWMDEVEVERREVKRETWARARVEERVPMRRVRGGVVEEEFVLGGESEIGGGEDDGIVGEVCEV